MIAMMGNHGIWYMVIMGISRKLWKQHREIIPHFGVDIGLPTRKLLGAPSIVSPYVVGRCRPEAGGLLATPGEVDTRQWNNGQIENAL